MKKITALITFLFLSACASKPDAYSNALDKLALVAQQADISCSASTKTESEKIACTKEIVVKSLTDEHFDDIAVLEKHYSLNESLAKKVDAGELKPEAYNKQKADLADNTVSFFYAKLNRLKLEEIERKQNAAIWAAAFGQGMNSMNNAYSNSAAAYGAAAQQPWTPPYQTPRRITTNCNTHGNELTCYSQ